MEVIKSVIVDTMKVFVTVIEQKNFTRAAELLSISQPNVSLHIRNLENELGTKLIHRSPKQVQITEAGKYYISMLNRYYYTLKKQNMKLMICFMLYQEN